MGSAWAKIGFHSLEIIVVSPAGALVLPIIVIAGGSGSRGTTILANMMLTGSGGQALNSFSLATAGVMAVPPIVVERILMERPVAIVGGNRLAAVVPRRRGCEAAAQSCAITDRLGADNVAQFLCNKRIIRQLDWEGRGFCQLTQIQDVAASARVQAQRRIACWAILRFEFFNVLVKAGFVGDVGAGELQHALSAQGVF
jgi:hypothetical protein